MKQKRTSNESKEPIPQGKRKTKNTSQGLQEIIQKIRSDLKNENKHLSPNERTTRVEVKQNLFYSLAHQEMTKHLENNYVTVKMIVDILRNYDKCLEHQLIIDEMNKKDDPNKIIEDVFGEEKEIENYIKNISENDIEEGTNHLRKFLDETEVIRIVERKLEFIRDENKQNFDVYALKMEKINETMTVLEKKVKSFETFKKLSKKIKQEKILNFFLWKLIKKIWN